MDTGAIAGLTLPDADGAPVRLGDLWRDGPAVLVWLRHYGWPFCREQVAQVRDEQSKFEAKGAKVAFIGMGLPLMARDFRSKLHVQAPVLLDRTKESYRALGLGRGTLGEILGPRELWPGLQAILRHGYRRPSQDWKQYGGALVVAQGGKVLFSHKARRASDIIPAGKLLAAL